MKKIILIVLTVILLSTTASAFPSYALGSDKEEDIGKYAAKISELNEEIKKELMTDICFYRYNVCNIREGFDNINDYTDSYLGHFFEARSDINGWGFSNGFIMSKMIYGPFDGGYVFYMSLGTILNSDLGGGTAAGDYFFPCGSSSFFYVLWKDKEITRLGKAYDDGKISDDALLIMSKLIKGTKTLTKEDKDRIRKQSYYTFFEEHVLEIKKAYLEYLNVKYKDDASKYKGCTIEDVTVKRYWELEQKIETPDEIYYEKTGFLLYMYCVKEELSDVSGKEIAGGYEFYDEYENLKFIVWKDGKFCSLQQAMSKGFISEETLGMMTRNIIGKDLTLARKLSEEECAAAKLTETSFTEAEMTATDTVKNTEKDDNTQAVSTETSVLLPANTEGKQTEQAPHAETTAVKSSDNVSDSTPKTGDMNVFIILALSASILAAVLIIKKRAEK